MYKILIVDNDLDTLVMMEGFLKREGYQVVKACSTHDAATQLDRENPDMAIIDMSSIDGVGLCRKLRSNARTEALPILLTGAPARNAVTSALDAGGDDFVAKPFAMREVSARIRAHMRRVSSINTETMPLIHLVPASQTVTVFGREVTLTQVEFDLFYFLCRHPNQLHSTEDLLVDVWHYPRGTGDAALVRNHIRNVRCKLEIDPERPAIIQSRHGRGYAVRANVQIEHNWVGVH